MTGPSDSLVIQLVVSRINQLLSYYYYYYYSDLFSDVSHVSDVYLLPALSELVCFWILDLQKEL